MRITVDLNKCNDHGQCVFSAPAVFSLEEAADVSPLQAIMVED
jgi:ferredoxin